MLCISETQPADWRYVSEGGATIVFSYQGPPNPKFDGTVLRLRKALVPSLRREKAANGNGHTKANGAELDDEPDDPTIEYQTRCMTRLIPQDHLPRLETVRLERAWLQELSKCQDVNRPDARRDKDEIDVDRKKGVLATDLVGGDWLAVEIKPKWAFLPTPMHLSEETKDIKLQTCRFCMHNHMRHVKDQETSSDYCPLDLFSGDKTRIRTAVLALWKAWTDSGATLNNLKIFAKGKPVLPSNAKKMLAPNVAEDVALEQIKEAFTDALVATLVDTPVLAILADLQRTLDTLDIEGLSQLWRHTEEAAPLYRTTFASFFEQPRDGGIQPPPSTPLGVSSLFLSAPEPDIPDWIDFLDTYLSPFRTQLDHSSPSPKHLRYYLLAYLLSATFKDCSIIVRLDLLRPGSEPQVKREPNAVTVIDLDPKSLDKLRGWLKLDREIVMSYAKHQASRKTCVDARTK